MPCVCVSGGKEREPAPKTAGRGGRRGVDREAACEFLFYCLTLLKKKKKLRIKCFDPFWHFALAAALCHSRLGGPELSPQHGAGAGMDFRLSKLPHRGCGHLGPDGNGMLAATPKPVEHVSTQQALSMLLGPA